MTTIRVFKYIEELDAFVVTKEFAELSDQLGLTEWNHVVWIGRLFILDNDYGEHWFDNWDERESLADRAKEFFIEENDLLLIVPEFFANGKDGPCNSPEIRKAFWTDVLKSLELSYELLFAKARIFNEQMKQLEIIPYVEDLEERISKIKQKFQI